jgi:N-acetylglucosaminyl-diphospho-decaprenol L-rhamnosyltransferase
LEQKNFAPAIDVVIVNWNSRELLRECLTALDCSTNTGELNVIVIDNASSDRSADGLAAERLHIDVVVNDENCGFAAACNQGASRGGAPLILFLNPDVRLKADALDKVCRYLTEPANAGVGIAGIQLIDAQGHVQRSCARTPTPAALMLRSMFLDRLCPALVRPHFLKEWDHRDTRPVDQVMGACLMIRRPTWEELGGFDERFFLYYEDVDLCVAARQAGWSVIYFAGAQAEHVGQGTTQAIKLRRILYEARSRIRYVAKRHGKAWAGLVGLLIVLFELPVRGLYATTVLSPREGWNVLRAASFFSRSRAKCLR